MYELFFVNTCVGLD